MASPEPKQADAEGPSVLCETSCPVDFTQISPSKFGISTQSFTPSLSKSKDKSQLKARRRSSIGARGSPGTNALIRFMSQHRANTPSFLKTPEAFKSGPFLPRVSSTLKKKMASFQSLMDVEEGERCDPVAGPKQDLSDGSLDGDKENRSPRFIPSKRRRVGPRGDCGSEISEAGSPILQHFSSQADPEETSFEVQSTGAPQLAELVAVDLPAQRALPFPSSSSSPALLEMEPFVVASVANSALEKRKKRVRFGGPLSPELFDSNLPPSTPLQKGTTPAGARPQTPGLCPGSGLRSLLKTPQRPAGWSPLPQPLFCSPTFFGGSPTLSLLWQGSAQTPEDDREKIAFPSMEATDSPSITDRGVSVVQPLDLNLAFQEESLTEAPTGGDAAEPGAEPSEDPGPPVEDPEEIPEEPPQPQLEEPATEPEPAVDAPTSSDTTFKKARSEAQPPSAVPAPVRPVSRKRKQLTEIEPVKRSSRSAAKSASSKMKTGRRWGSKEVDRSLYGFRGYASKNPALSPIKEGLGCLSALPTLQPPDSSEHSEDIGEDPARLSSPTSEQAGNSLPVPGDVSPVPLLQRDDTGSNTTHPSDAPANAAVPDQEVSSLRRGRQRFSTPAKMPVRRRRKVSVPVEAWLTEESQEQPEAQVEGSESSVAKTLAGDSDGPSGQPLVGARAQAGEEQEPESHTVLPAPSAPSPLPEVEAARRPEEEMAPLETTREEAQVALAPWQMDFLVEDVFKPVATRGQRSVRRSLRNQKNNEEHCGSGLSGLTWLPRTSPDSVMETRRKVRRKT